VIGSDFGASPLPDGGKGFAGALEYRLAAFYKLHPAPDGNVHIARIELDQPRPASGALGGQQRRTRSAERIKDKPVALLAVLDRISDHGDGLDGRVVFEILTAVTSKTICASVVPDICPIAPVLAELDIVEVRGLAGLEDEY